jgi:breast cancer 2 susceptibility protein
MILCVSKITWTEGGVADDGTALLPFPELEVTDGWYRLRAKVDEPIARAIRRKIIRVGRKIAVVGARVCMPNPRMIPFGLTQLQLSSSKKEPCEILEAYDSVSLKLAGNSSHLACWHAKLGFQKHISISTLHSLTPDGGNATLMNLVVVKVRFLT